jgi:pimeloyl-ACP methyl ester carboxylesterase
VRRALGITRWNVYGESYGATVAMTLATLHPETLAQLVLDSIEPPDPVPLWSQTVADARDAFLAAWRARSGMRPPDLAQTYRETLDRLAVPLAMPAPVALRQLGDPLAVSAPGFEALGGAVALLPRALPGTAANRPIGARRPRRSVGTALRGALCRGGSPSRERSMPRSNAATAGISASRCRPRPASSTAPSSTACASTGSRSAHRR